VERIDRVGWFGDDAGAGAGDDAGVGAELRPARYFVGW